MSAKDSTSTGRQWLTRIRNSLSTMKYIYLIEGGILVQGENQAERFCRNFLHDFDPALSSHLPQRLKFFITKISKYQVFICLYNDVKHGILEGGETTPLQFWQRVWKEIVTSHGGPPHNLHYQFLKDEWNELKSSGKHDFLVWSQLQQKHPVLLLSTPLFSRWICLGKYHSLSNYNMFSSLDTVCINILNAKNMPELRDKCINMNYEGRKEEFINQHWNELFKNNTKYVLAITPLSVDTSLIQKHGDRVLFTYKGMKKNKIMWFFPYYTLKYPSGYEVYDTVFSKLMPAEKSAVFKEFDFYS